MSSITIENNHLLNSVLKLSVWTIKSKQRIFEMSSLSDECLYFIQSSTDQQKIWEFEYDERNFVIECDWEVVYLWYFRHCAMKRSRCSLINQWLTKTLSDQSMIDEDFIRSILTNADFSIESVNISDFVSSIWSFWFFLTNAGFSIESVNISDSVSSIEFLWSSPD